MTSQLYESDYVGDIQVKVENEGDLLYSPSSHSSTTTDTSINMLKIFKEESNRITAVMATAVRCPICYVQFTSFLSLEVHCHQMHPCLEPFTCCQCYKHCFINRPLTSNASKQHVEKNVCICAKCNCRAPSTTGSCHWPDQFGNIPNYAKGNSF